MLCNISKVICVCCVVCSIMSTVTPLHNMKKIADLVLGLFLVCSAVLPVIGLLSYADYYTDLKMEETISVEDYEDSYNELILNSTAENLVKATDNLLLSEDIKAENIKIGIKKNDDNSIYISTLIIYITKDYENRIQDIQKIIGSNMSKEPVVICE